MKKAHKMNDFIVLYTQGKDLEESSQNSKL